MVTPTFTVRPADIDEYGSWCRGARTLNSSPYETLTATANASQRADLGSNDIARRARSPFARFARINLSSTRAGGRFVWLRLPSRFQAASYGYGAPGLCNAELQPQGAPPPRYLTCQNSETHTFDADADRRRSWRW